jgi:peptidoglycan hydrolase-like protein with peptidoglycan-binding domain
MELPIVMRSLLAATLIFVATQACVQAQMTAPAMSGSRPKPVATPPIHTPTDAASAMEQAERRALQSDLAWVGLYNGAISGDASERMVDAVKEFQKQRGAQPTGEPGPEERRVLADTARRRQENVGWKIIADTGTGAKLGIPAKLVPQQSNDADGTKWSSADGTVQILLTHRKQDNPTTAKLAEHEKNDPPGRTIGYSVVKPDFFVLSGMQGAKKFYVRGTFKGNEVRLLTVLYDQATASTVEPVVIAMSSAFNPFPGGAATTAAAVPPKAVEYGTGVVVTGDGAIVTSRALTDGCLAITVAGFGNADRVAEDREHGLALLRLYGVQGLKPLKIAGGMAKPSVELRGITDPQNQSGGAAVSSIRSLATPNSGGDPTLSPAPALGFSGSAALDDAGNFAGIALLKPIAVAGPPAATAAAQAVLVPADAVGHFLKASGVSTDGTSTDASAAVVRVICVRK